MKILYSYERHVYPGNMDYVAVLLGRQWVPCSGIVGNKYLGRDYFFLKYEVKVAGDAIVATFKRRCKEDGTTNELVEVEFGDSFSSFNFTSFEDANRWAADNAPFTCPMCGALLEDCGGN